MSTRFARTLICMQLMLAGLVVTDSSTAQSLCSEPIQPICSTDILTSYTPFEVQRCQEDTNQYIDKLEEYRRCLESASSTVKEQVLAARQFKSCLSKSGQDCSIPSGN